MFLPRKESIDWPGQVTHHAFSNFDRKGNPMFRHGDAYIEYIKENLRRIDRLNINKEIKRIEIINFLNKTRKDLMTGKIDFLYKDKL